MKWVRNERISSYLGFSMKQALDRLVSIYSNYLSMIKEELKKQSREYIELLFYQDIEF